MASAFRNVITFFDKIGLYDVVLPFLLVFTIVFAILEKTKVLGTEIIDGKHYPKKNLNTMTAFVIAFLVVASTRLVAIINQVASQVVILLMLSVLFLLLIGSFYKEGEGVFLEGGWKTFFVFIMFIGIVLIFMNALGWLEGFWDYLKLGTGGEAIGAIILLIIIILSIVYIVKQPEMAKASSSK